MRQKEEDEKDLLKDFRLLLSIFQTDLEFVANTLILLIQENHQTVKEAPQPQLPLAFGF